METQDLLAPRLVSYDNYRGFLRDWYLHSKSLNSKVSFRFLSQRTGLRSPNYWKLIMEGERKLSNEMIPRFASTLKLPELESHYFHHLVLMNQSDGIKERALHAQHVADLRKRLEPITVTTPQVDYFSRWYLPILREVAVVCRMNNSFREIHSRLRINITEHQVAEGIAMLIDGGYLKRALDGSFTETNKLLSTGDRVTSALAAQYLARMIEESLPALEELPAAEREFGAQTLSLGPDQFEQLKVLARNFRKEALRLAEQGAGKNPAEQVVQINLQIFPLTHKKQGTSK
ncbi:MAG: TIGR02147 family protein [Bdellovibrionota bacterium]